ncbi:MAG TPA: methyltransferase domain-containing protein [Candidatus Methylomirabilis sp.]|nr:methyltransferase domain-containing protein [Candidatus Methylomirabilis sp.]
MEPIEYDRIAKEFGRNRAVNPAVLQDLIRTGRLAGASNVLEVGCGTGNYIAAIARTVGCSCWGVDPSARMLALAQRHAPANLILRKEAAENLLFPGAFFNLIFSVDVIHHMPSRDAYFRRAHRQLAPSGCLCTVTDSDEIIRTREPLSRYFPETAAVDLQRYPTMPQLRAELHGAHFHEIWETATALPYAITDLTPYREKAYSSLHLISDAAFARGLARMEADLSTAPIRAVARYAHLWARR